MDFIKVASACPNTRVSDVDYNVENILLCINEAQEKNCKFIVFPELCVTSYTCADLFLQEYLLNKASQGIEHILNSTKTVDMLIAVGSTLVANSTIYNCAYLLFKGKILGIVPKSYIPNYSEFYEKRWFSEGISITNQKVDLPYQKDIPFGTDLIFSSNLGNFGVEICEDLWVTIPPSSYLSLMGAHVIGNLSASNELVSKADYRRALISNQSARCICSYI